MATKRLVKATVVALRPAQRPFYLWDSGKGAVTGFGVKVLPSGRKTAIFKYRLRGAGRAGSARWFKIGEIGRGLTFSKAKDIAEQLRASVLAGGDPAREAKANTLAVIQGDQESKERTFKALANTWLKKKTKLKSYAELNRIVGRNLTELHRQPVTALTPADLETLLDKIEDRAPVMAARTLQVLQSVLDQGIKMRWIAENPAQHIEVDAGLPKGRRDRVLSDSELVKVWNGTKGMGYPYGRTVQLLILTAGRRSEVIDADWAEFDFRASVWRLPAERSKNGLAHEIHLSPQAVELLMSLPSAKRGKPPKCGLIFTTTGQTPIGGLSKYKTRLDTTAKVKNWRLHDIRRTVVTNMREMGISSDVVELLLNHKSGTRAGIAGVYARAKLMEPRKQAILAWGERVAALVAGRIPAENVADMTKRRKA